MTFKAVGFDNGGVLRGQPEGNFTSKAVKLLGINEQAFSDAYHRYSRKPNLDEITWEELWRLVLVDLGKPEKLSELLRIDAEFYGEATVNGPVIAIVDQIRANGYKTGLLSNNNSALLEEIQQNGIINHFDVINISAITGLVKPAVEAFAHFAKDLGVQLDELVYIDDSKRSLGTAVECGYTPILFENAKQLATDLQKLGLIS
jgi:HAD superfamily hydrolase (TIGR01509 family)